jgi:hypothetical protein
MDSRCSSDGNIGYPLIINGIVDISAVKELNIKPYFSFGSIDITYSDSKLPLIAANGSPSTIMYNKMKYTLKNIQLTPIFKTNAIIDQAGVRAVFTFANDEIGTPFAILLSTDIYQSDAGKSSDLITPLVTNQHRTNLSITDLNSIFNNKDYYTYFSCIPYLKTKTSVIDADKNNANIYGKKILVCHAVLPMYSFWLKKELISAVTGYKYPFASTNEFAVSDTISGERINIKSGSTKNTPNLFTLNANANGLFYNRVFLYRFNASTLDVIEPSKLIYLNKLKCYPVKRKQDINGDILLIDPATGKRMDNYLRESDVTVANEMQVSKKESRKILIIIGSILGALIGIFILYVLIYFLFSNTKMATASAAAAASVAAATVPAVAPAPAP